MGGGDVVKKTLSFLLLLESLCPQVLSQLSLASKLTRLMCVFLIGKMGEDKIIWPPDPSFILLDNKKNPHTLCNHGLIKWEGWAAS